MTVAMAQSLLDKETERVAVLRDYDILGSAPESAYDEIGRSQKIHLRCVGRRRERGSPYGVRGCGRQDQRFRGGLSSHEGPVRFRAARQRGGQEQGSARNVFPPAN